MGEVDRMVEYQGEAMGKDTSVGSQEAQPAMATLVGNQEAQTATAAPVGNQETATGKEVMGLATRLGAPEAQHLLYQSPLHQILTLSQVRTLLSPSPTQGRTLILVLSG